MKEKLLKIFQVIGLATVAFLGIFFAFFKKSPINTEDKETEKALEKKVKEQEDKLEEIEKAEERLKEDGVKDLTSEEELEYWKEDK